MAQVPQDLIVEILLRLPAKSVLRFRCLSKSLSAVVDRSDFINSHLSKSSENFNFRKLIFSDGAEDGKFHVCDVNLEEEILLLEKPFSSLWKRPCGYCKGLLLLSRSELGLALWNPSTRRCRDLPDCPFEVTANVGSCSVIASGLGYDDSIDDYKAFIMVNVKQKLQSEIEIQVWIYGLKSNIWRRAQNFPYLQFRTDTYPGFPKFGYFTTDGSLNWLYTLLSNKWQSEIVAFDLRKETFSIVPQPVSSREEVLSDPTELHALEGCLAITYFFNPTSKKDGIEQADLYIRKKDGVDMFIWTKLFSVTATTVEPLSFDIYFFESVYVFGYSKRGDKILLELSDFLLVSYDVKEKSFAKVEINKDPDWIFPIICLESLVSVDGGA